MVSLGSSVLLGVKKLIRPLIPDWLMSRYRLAQWSKHSRVNVDVFVPDQRSARRWLAVTPDTYRVLLTLPAGDPPANVRVVTDDDFQVTDRVRRQALGLLADPGIGAAVVGEVSDTQLSDRRRAEPVIGPSMVLVREEVLDEVGGVPAGPHPLPGLLARLKDAGHRLGLIPIEPVGAPYVRTDPIDAPSVVILATVPLHDVGGGARSSQLAVELLRQGYHVTVVHFAEAVESVDLGLRYIHPRLEQYRADQFEARELVPRVQSEKTLVIVEAPFGSLVTPVPRLQAEGWRLAYDIIDDWSDPALGAGWYSPKLEKVLLRRSDMVFASAPDLVERARRLGREALLVPNAVNAEIFGVDLPPRPPDLPDAGSVIGYHGSLYGNWFDWAGLAAVAEAFPEAAVVLIGDDRVPRPEMPGSVHFLGLKPQHELPGYIQRFDVGLIPFMVTDTTHAVSPLKVYEYLASGVPVAAPPLRSLRGLDGVFVDDDLVAAVEAALAGNPPDRAATLRAHSWAARVARLGLPNPPHPNDPPTRIVHRPAVHYGKGDRVP